MALTAEMATRRSSKEEYMEQYRDEVEEKMMELGADEYDLELLDHRTLRNAVMSDYEPADAALSIIRMIFRTKLSELMDVS